MNPDRGKADFIKNFIGSACGLGLLPIAPGSFGALLGVIIHGVVYYLFPGWLQWPSLVAALLMLAAANAILTPWAVNYWKSEDPGNFVLDEVAGYLVIPIIYKDVPFLKAATVGFILFRIFDIIKLPVARQIDRNWHGAWGIFLDDIVSGLYAALVLYLLICLGF